MVDDEKVGLLQAIWRFISFWKLRKAMGIARAANRQFTDSAGGIRDAYDLEQERLIRQFREYRDAVSEVEMVIADDSDRLEKLNGREGELLQLRDGADAALEEAMTANDEAEQEKHLAAGERFQTEIDQIEAQQGELEGRIQANKTAMERHLRGLTKLQAEVQKLPVEKAQAIADHVSAKKIIALNDRLSGMTVSFESGPLAAVREANRKLTAKARISDKLAGTDVRVQDDEYARKGRASSTREQMLARIAAKKAEKAGKTGGAEASTEMRPEA